MTPHGVNSAGQTAVLVQAAQGHLAPSELRPPRRVCRTQRAEGSCILTEPSGGIGRARNDEKLEQLCLEKTLVMIHLL